jgi:Ca2+/Na+ antiporter
MIAPTKIDLQKIKAKIKVKKPWDDALIFVLNLLITVPVFIILHQNILDPEWVFNLDRVLLFVIIAVFFQIILKRLQVILVVVVLVYFLVLVYGSLVGNYGFNSVYEDYNAMMYSMAESPHPQDLILEKLLPFPNKSKIISAIEYQNPKVRNFAIMATSKYFKHAKGYSDYRTIIQCFAVFKEVNRRWNYVSDPKQGDYIATARESLLYFSGDCDDHSVLMASAIRAIGGTPRLIHTKGHMYPELLIGSIHDLEKINYLIKNVLFAKESYKKKLHFHIDEYQQVWLNLDYTANYPGGPFLSQEILGALTLN